MQRIITLYFYFTCFKGSTGVMFSDVAGIDDAVEELQEVNLISLKHNFANTC